MMTAGRRARREVQSLVERTFGLHISRTAEPATKHADEAVQGLRRWSSADVVFDVGANDGRTILRIQERLSSPRIFAFEPVSTAYRTLLSRTAHLANVRPFQVALGAERSRAVVHVAEIASMSSLLPQWTATSTAEETVDVWTVDDIMRAHAVEHVHFLKIDTEGYELEVLKGAEQALRESRITLLQVEVGVGQMGKAFVPLEQARVHLAARGYLLYGIYNQCRTAARPPAGWNPREPAYRPQALAYCDALFVRADVGEGT